MEASSRAGLLLCLALLALAAGTSAARGRALRSATSSTTSGNGGGGGRSGRRALVLAVVGDGAQWPAWLNNATCDERSFDLALIYYGASPWFTCAECAHVWFARGAKWRLIHDVLTSEDAWREISSYEVVMLADDDLIMSAAELDMAFSIFQDYRLVLAQPSVCKRPGSHSAWEIVLQRPAFVLRYTSFVEVMAPMVAAEFLPHLRTLLADSHTGWGLDFLMPYTLGYPWDKVAVIDAMRMVHPVDDAPSQQTDGHPPRQRVYSLDLPRTAQEEWDYVLAKHGVTKEVMESHGVPWLGTRIWGAVALDAWHPDTPQCRPAHRRLMEEALGEPPLYWLAVTLAQVVIMSCGALALGVKCLETARGHRHAAAFGKARSGELHFIKAGLLHDLAALPTKSTN